MRQQPASGPADPQRQPYRYRRVELVEPDWRRLPGYRDVTPEQWRSAQWQRAHCVKNVAQLRSLMGDLLDESFYADLERDQRERATMSMLVPRQMMNTMVPCPDVPPARPASPEAFSADPVPRYIPPLSSARRAPCPSPPSPTLHSSPAPHMWAAPRLPPPSPTKVLPELLPTCPNSCGHCTRMDLVGN